MKRLFLLFFSALLCTAVSAYSFEVDGICYNITSSSDMTVEVTYQGLSYNSYSGSVVIPEKVTYNSKEYSVTSIGEYAFHGCSSLTSVTIPNSVTCIGNYAFKNCPGMNSVTIPNSVTSIGNDAFFGCSSLTSVVIPNSVTSIGGRAFHNCNNLNAIYIEDLSAWCNIKFSSFNSNPTNYANHLYLNGEEITNLVIPSDVTSIGDYAFFGCSSLTSVTIPNSVTSIGNRAFYECSRMTAVHITNLSAWCNIKFSGNESNPTRYAHHLYLHGEEITDLVIPDDISSIGWYAFEGCSGITSVTIPNSVISIGERAFSGCSGLKTMRLEDGESTLTLPDNFSNTIDSLYLGRNIAVKSSYFNTGENKLSVLSIGKYVVSLDDKMFNECKNIAKIISYATEPPVAYPLTFTTDIYGKATLSVLGESMEKYRNADVWKKFSKIEEIDNNPNATDQCAAPVITYADGKLQFACETAGAEYMYTLTASDAKSSFAKSAGSVDLTACYDITAYAVAEGYKNSEQVTATLYWINGSDVSTNINQTEMRGVMAACSGGIITVSGLTDGETVMFYDANGALLYTGTAQSGTISYAPSASGVIIVKIGKTSIKVVK